MEKIEIYIFLGLVGLFAIWGALSIYRLLFRLPSQARKKGFFKALVSYKSSLFFMALCIVGTLLIIQLINSFYLARVPEKLGVTTILSKEQDSAGFGPGGNESGVISYRLPSKIARDIRAYGLAYFEDIDTKNKVLSVNKYDSHFYRAYYALHQLSARVHYSYWKETPANSEFKLSRFLDKYGFGVKINPKIETQINNAMNSPGSYIASGSRGGGFLLVAPEVKRVFFIYAG